MSHGVISDVEVLRSAGMDFPGERIKTQIKPEDLVVPDQVIDELRIIETWVRHSEDVQRESSFSKYLQPGYRCLFWGPTGTGKVLAAGLLANSLDKEAYRIDLSIVVSKWIGETEKNLSVIFEDGERNGWILFFDEADALFASRSAASSSNDRYANQQVSYLLQRMESYPGLVILATNLRTNLDDALMRRIQSFVHFATPDSDLRERLWQQMLASYEHNQIDIKSLAEEFEITGGVIANVVQYAVLVSLQEGRDEILLQDIRTGIARELEKEGKAIV